MVCLILLLGMLSFVFRGSALDESWEEAMNKVLSHDARVPPDYERDYATRITIQVYILSFDSISESTMDYSLSIFLRQKWVDHRMTYEKLPGVDKLELDARVMNSVWVPDLYFINEKKASFHEVTVPNKLMHVYPDGRVFYSVRVSMLLSCDMNLQKFPFDSQICHVSMESYSYSTENILFKWDDSPILLRDHLKLPQFSFEESKNLDCTKRYAGTNNSIFSCLRAQFHLNRNYGYYIAQVYVPSILIVILSWVSFWLDIDAVPARISLGLLTVLTMTTQSANARSHLPRVSYIKAIDVWMAMCLFFVFAALIEFAYVNVHARVERRRTTQMSQAHGGLKLDLTSGRSGVAAGANANGDPDDDNDKVPRRRLFSKTTIGRAKARHLDKISRYAFPIVFVAFNIFYWAFYLLWEPENPDY